MKEGEFIAHDLDDLLPIADKILKASNGLYVFAFFGSMGAGKTTFIKTFCKALNVIDEVNSPTFSIVNEYFTKNNKSVFHFDFYRIKKIEEVYDIGYEEYIYSDNYCFMEWPALIMELLPPSYVYISIAESDNGKRLIKWKIKGDS